MVPCSVNSTGPPSGAVVNICKSVTFRLLPRSSVFMTCDTEVSPSICLMIPPTAAVSSPCDTIANVCD